MPSEVVSPGTRMLRFLTPTEGWARRVWATPSVYRRSGHSCLRKSSLPKMT